ncbi:hypothetical protein MPL3365_130612 [Mesorhizobium plurifarium]|uniref:Uncharacterized protein n=1 Tax=Mesorhizobium plurifarium TaxID=69974 RepID=A0A090GT03_MESPL|nr:hypothetical protein MPL3365_130612 [Mesorhizobium plurifarium]
MDRSGIFHGTRMSQFLISRGTPVRSEIFAYVGFGDNCKMRRLSQVHGGRSRRSADGDARNQPCAISTTTVSASTGAVDLEVIEHALDPVTLFGWIDFSAGRLMIRKERMAPINMQARQVA